MRRGRRAIWIMGILCALGLMVLVLLFGPGLSGRVTDRAVRRSLRATASAVSAPDSDAGEATGSPSTSSPHAAPHEGKQPDPVESVRIEEIGASGSPDRARLEVVIEDELGQALPGVKLILHNGQELDLGEQLGRDVQHFFCKSVVPIVKRRATRSPSAGTFVRSPTPR